MSLEIVWATQFRFCFSLPTAPSPQNKTAGPQVQKYYPPAHTSAQVCTAYILVKTQATKRKQSKSSDEYIRVCLSIYPGEPQI